MSLWAISNYGMQRPDSDKDDQDNKLENARVDYRDPLSIMLTLETQAINNLRPFDPTEGDRRLNKAERKYISNYIKAHI